MKMFTSDVGLTCDQTVKSQSTFSTSHQIHSTCLSDWHNQKRKYQILKIILGFSCLENWTSDILCRFQTWAFYIVECISYREAVTCCFFFLKPFFLTEVLQHKKKIHSKRVFCSPLHFWKFDFQIQRDFLKKV